MLAPLFFLLLLLRKRDRALAAGALGFLPQERDKPEAKREDDRNEDSKCKRPPVRTSSAGPGFVVVVPWPLHSLTKSHEILHQPAKAALHPKVTYEHDMVTYLVARGRGLFAGARIGIAKFHIEPAEE